MDEYFIYKNKQNKLIYFERPCFVIFIMLLTKRIWDQFHLNQRMMSFTVIYVNDVYLLTLRRTSTLIFLDKTFTFKKL